MQEDLQDKRKLTLHSFTLFGLNRNGTHQQSFHLCTFVQLILRAQIAKILKCFVKGKEVTLSPSKLTPSEKARLIHSYAVLAFPRPLGHAIGPQMGTICSQIALIERKELLTTAMSRHRSFLQPIVLHRMSRNKSKQRYNKRRFVSYLISFLTFNFAGRKQQRLIRHMEPSINYKAVPRYREPGNDIAV